MRRCCAWFTILRPHRLRCLLLGGFLTAPCGPVRAAWTRPPSSSCALTCHPGLLFAADSLRAETFFFLQFRFSLGRTPQRGITDFESARPFCLFLITRVIDLCHRNARRFKWPKVNRSKWAGMRTCQDWGANTAVTESRCCHWCVCNLGISASLNCSVLIRTIGSVLPSYPLFRLR